MADIPGVGGQHPGLQRPYPYASRASPLTILTTAGDRVTSTNRDPAGGNGHEHSEPVNDHAYAYADDNNYAHRDSHTAAPRRTVGDPGTGL